MEFKGKASITDVALTGELLFLNGKSVRYCMKTL